MARIYWKDRDPVGGRFMFGQPRPDQEPQWITVVGVVKDIKQRSLTERPSPSVMIPILQFYSSTAVSTCATATGLDTMSAQLQRAMRELDPRVPFYNVSKLADHTKAATFQQKLAGDLLVVFGALALVAGRHRQLRRAVVSSWACAGARSAFASRSARRGRRVPADRRQRREVDRHRPGHRTAAVDRRRHGPAEPADRNQPTDPITYAGVIGVLSVVAAAACLLPARRAPPLDPVTTLREE